MAFTYIAFFACIAAASAGLLSQVATPIAVAQPVLAKTEDYDPNPQYTFGYDVQDAISGDNKNQVESRDGDVVRGQYSLNDADGYRRIVDYTADPINGFNAVVRREPLGAVAVKTVAAAPAIIKAAPAPLAYAAAPTLIRSAPAQLAYASAPTLIRSAPAQLAYASAPTLIRSAPAQLAYAAAPTLIRSAPTLIRSAPAPLAYAAGPTLIKSAPALSYSTGPAIVKTSYSSPIISYAY